MICIIGALYSKKLNIGGVVNKFLICFFAFVSFFTLGSFQSLQCTEDDYRRYVESVSFEADGEDLIAQIQMDDGTCWKFVTDAYDEELLYQFQEDVLPGSEVYLEILDNTKLFLLTVKSIDRDYLYNSYLVSLTQESTQLLPQIVRIEKYSKLNSGEYEENYGYRLTLSDGSIWKFEKIPGLIKSWKTGDRVFITCWLFKYWKCLNIDAPYYDGSYNSDRRHSSDMIYVGQK